MTSPNITKQEFLKLMQFPNEWVELDMYPPDKEFFKGQLDAYEPGQEKASEHFRNGAFHWWLKRNPSKATLKKLAMLVNVDSYKPMADDVRKYIAKSPQCDDDIRRLIKPA